MNRAHHIVVCNKRRTGTCTNFVPIGAEFMQIYKEIHRMNGKHPVDFLYAHGTLVTNKIDHYIGINIDLMDNIWSSLKNNMSK